MTKGLTGALIAIAMISNAEAANWIPIDGYPDIVYDKESLLQGNNGPIVWIRSANGQDLRREYFDCKYRTFSEVNDQILSPPISLRPGSIGEAIMNTVCKSSWEFWK